MILEVHQSCINRFSKRKNLAILGLKMMHPHNSDVLQGFFLSNFQE